MCLLFLFGIVIVAFYEGDILTSMTADARIVHKTGTGFPLPEGLQDMNDAGIILMPDGSHVIKRVQSQALIT